MIDFSAKKNGLIILSCMITHHTFSLGESRLSSKISCGFSEPYILKLCLFSNPKTWSVDSSLKQTRFKNPGSKSNLSIIVTVHSFRHGLSSGLRACSNLTLYA